MRCPLPAATPGKCHHHRKRDQLNHWGAEQQYSSWTADAFQNASTVWWDGLQWTSTPVQIQCINSKKLRVLLACKVKVCSTLQGGCMNRALLSQYHFLFYGFSSIFSLLKCEYNGYKEKYILFNSCISKKIRIRIQNYLEPKYQKGLEGCWKALHFIERAGVQSLTREVLKLYKRSSSKLYLRAELPFKAKELALKSQSCQNLELKWEQI